MGGYFLPGWGAPPSLYTAALPDGWTALQAPTFAETNGDLGRYVDWLDSVIAGAPKPVALAGHSMGAALAILAAHRDPARIRRLLLVSPAGLPLTKPLSASLGEFAHQLLARSYPRDIGRSLASAATAPRAALRLARAVRALDLRAELGALRTSGVPCRVVACATDTLTTTAHCRRIARLVGADFRELRIAGGHMWMLDHPAVFTTLFQTG